MKNSQNINNSKIYAVVGVSKDSNKYGHKVYKKLLKNNFTVYPINPKHDQIGNKPCFPDISSLPQVPDILVIVVPPEITEKIVKQAYQNNIKTIWMQPGSQSEEAIEYCHQNKIEVIYNSCIVIDGLHQNFN